MYGVNAATAIFAQHGQFIRAIIYSKIGHEAGAEDIFQDFFLSLAHKPPPDDVKNIKSYLYSAITHDIADAMRRMNAYRVRLEELIEKRLPSSQSKAVILRYKHGYEIKEIAEAMRVDSRSVSRYICLGLRAIRQLFPKKRGNSND